MVPIREKMIQSQIKFEKLAQEYRTAGRDKMNQLRAEMELAQIEFQANMKMWKVLINNAQMQMSYT